MDAEKSEVLFGWEKDNHRGRLKWELVMAVDVVVFDNVVVGR